MNLFPCGDCKNFDEITVGNGSKKGRMGWCIARSLYALGGRKPPPGAKVAPAGVLAKPKVVTMTEIVANCTTFVKNT